MIPGRSGPILPLLLALPLLLLAGCDGDSAPTAARSFPHPPSQSDPRLAEGLAAYRSGEFGQASRLLPPVAERGEAQAQAALARMHLRNEGVTRNYGKALVWARKAAGQGNAEAQALLAEMYAYGWGVERDAGKAMAWRSRAEANGWRMETGVPPAETQPESRS